MTSTPGLHAEEHLLLQIFFLMLLANLQAEHEVTVEEKSCSLCSKWTKKDHFPKDVCPVPPHFFLCLSTSLSCPVCHAWQHVPWLCESWWISQCVHADWPAGCYLLEKTRIWIITAFASLGSTNLGLRFPPCPQFGSCCQLEEDGQVLHVSTFVMAEYRSLSVTSCQFFAAFTRN